VMEPHFSYLHHVYDEVLQYPLKSTLLHILHHWLWYMTECYRYLLPCLFGNPTRSQDEVAPQVLDLSFSLPIQYIYISTAILHHQRSIISICTTI
jgi:hypothetical protein